MRTEADMVKRLWLKPHFQSPTRKCCLLIPDFPVLQLPAMWWFCVFWNVSFTRRKEAKFSHYYTSKKWRKKTPLLIKKKYSDLFHAFPHSPSRTSSRRQFQEVTFAMEVYPWNAAQGQVLEETFVVDWVVTGIWLSPKQHVRSGVTVSVTH